MTKSYTFKGRDVGVLSGPCTDTAVRFLTDPANDSLHARLPCQQPGHLAVQLWECHEDHLHLPHTRVPLDHAWFRGLEAIFQLRMPSPLTHRLIHPVRRKKANKRTKQCTGGDAYVVGRYRDDHWDPDCPGPSMRFVPLAALMFLLGDVFDGHRQQDDPESVPLLTPHARGGTIARPWSKVS